MSTLEQAAEWLEHSLDVLSGVPSFTLRVGDCRVISDWHRDDEVLFVHRIDHRRNVYDR